MDTTQEIRVDRRCFVLASFAMAFPSVAFAEDQDDAWRNGLSSIREQVAAAHPRYRNSALPDRRGRVKLISGGEFDRDYYETQLTVLLVPIAGVNGETAASVTARLYRLGGWRNTTTVSIFSDFISIRVKGRRSFRVNRFSTPCVVLWNKERIYPSLPPGCYPPSQTYDEARSRGC